MEGAEPSGKDFDAGEGRDICAKKLYLTFIADIGESDANIVYFQWRNYGLKVINRKSGRNAI